MSLRRSKAPCWTDICVQVWTRCALLFFLWSSDVTFLFQTFGLIDQFTDKILDMPQTMGQAIIFLRTTWRKTASLNQTNEHRRHIF